MFTILHEWHWFLAAAITVFWWFGVYSVSLGQTNRKNQEKEIQALSLSVIFTTVIFWRFPRYYGEMGALVLAVVFFLGSIGALWLHKKKREALVVEEQKRLFGKDS